MSAELLLSFSILTPVVAAVLISLSGRFQNIRESYTLLASIIVFTCNLSLYEKLIDGHAVKLTVFEPIKNISVSFSIEPLGMLFSLVASFLWIITSVYSIGYMRARKELNQTRFYACFALAIASTMAISFSDNLFTLFIFYELLTLLTYPLVTHSGTEKARQSGRVYLGVLLGTSIMLQLLAIVWIWNLTGNLTFTQGGILGNNVDSTLLTILFTLFMFGIGKAAIMPFHKWLPAAMVAPTPVSALLHAVAVVKAGVFTALKVTVYIFGIDVLTTGNASQWVMYAVMLTVILASLIALRQDNLKALLAYSTISQLSYVVLATVILAPLSVIGAALHIAAHAFGKITLFFAAGSIYVTENKTQVSQLDGIGYRMPVTMVAFTIGSLSMIGIPPTVGFLSKWYILQGAFDVQNWLAIIVLVLSTLLNAAYFLPIVYKSFFKPDKNRDTVICEAPFQIVFALLVTSLMTLLLFLFPGQVLSLINLIKV